MTLQASCMKLQLEERDLGRTRKLTSRIGHAVRRAGLEHIGWGTFKCACLC